MSNKDIDPEIGEFYDFVKRMDKALIGAFTEGRRVWLVKPTVCLKYRTAMKRKTVNDDFFFQIKLIHTEKGANSVTLIYGNDRTKLTSEDITYGKYADQFICPAYLYYDSDGIHLIWQAHQIVLSTVEKVFLEHCILDHMDGSLPPAPVPVPVSAPARHLHHYTTPPVPSHTVQMPSMSRLSINIGELKSVISGLRKYKEEFKDED